ncbi:MAG: flagellar basal body P-ring formation protein FlgA [Nitrosomonadales bacterium]|nr:flagellar basal body P-ring formation protein FlgA [Nitrosomonadales bacterium]
MKKSILAPPVWLLAALTTWALTAWAAPQQSHAGIRAAIADFARAQTLDLPGQVTVKTGEIDRRIALPACPELEPFLPPAGRLLGNITVGIRCPTVNGWTLFVPVQIKVQANLLIAVRPLQQGQMLRAEDLVGRNGELSQPGTLTDPAQAVGKVLKFGVGTGQVLNRDMLRAPYVVSQGQTVQLQIEGGGYRIHSEGQALNNAAEGQSLRIKAVSGQVISGMARSDGSVEILQPAVGPM